MSLNKANLPCVPIPLDLAVLAVDLMEAVTHTICCRALTMNIKLSIAFVATLLLGLHVGTAHCQQIVVPVSHTAECSGCEGGCDACSDDANCDGGGLADSFKGCLSGGLHGLRQHTDWLNLGHGHLLHRNRHCYPGCHCPLCQNYHPWVSLSYMNVWSKGSTAPPLVTTSTPTFGGVIGAGDTRVLYGGDIGTGAGNGGKLDFGGWLTRDFGAGGSFMAVSPHTTDFSMSTDGTGAPLLAIPYIDVFPAPASNNARIIGAPVGSPQAGSATGTITIDHSTEILGADAYLRTNLFSGPGFRLDLIGGYQYSQIRDNLTLQATTTNVTGTFLPGSTSPGDTRFLEDRFDADNNFHGGTLGLMSDMRYRRLKVSMAFKVAFGTMQQRVTVNGLENRSYDPSFPVSAGTFALNTNIGTYEQNLDAVIPSLELKVGYDVWCGVHAFVGYNATYWSEVVLAANTINPRLDDRQFSDLDIIGAATEPEFFFNSTDFWMQGLTFGIEKQF